MALAVMLATDPDALRCDLAETYHLYLDNFEELPAERLAVFAYGLNDDSRIKRAISKRKVKTDTLLLAAIVDRLSVIAYMLGKHGGKKPQSLVNALTKNERPADNCLSFSSGAEFERARAAILEKIKNKG